MRGGGTSIGKNLASLLCLAIASCGDIHTGGFETYDLQARVQRPDGSPVASARVWLVRSRGEAAPAIALDSSWTDASGTAHFSAPADGTAGLGLDVQRDDSMGIALSVFKSATSASVLMAPARKITILGDSSGAPRCFVPGSHFVSNPGTDGIRAVISLPQGTWSLAVAQGAAPTVVMPFSVTKDSSIAAGSLVATADPSSLPDGPDISLDSFQFAGLSYVRNPSFVPGWTAIDDTLASVLLSQPIFGQPGTDSIALRTGPIRYLYQSDSVDGQRAFQMSTSRLPDRGLLALRIRYSEPFQTDSGRVLRFSLLDSLQSGAMITFAPKFSTAPDSSKIHSKGSFQVAAHGTFSPAQLMSSTTWYLAWTPDRIEIRNSDGFVGSVTTSTSMSGGPTFTLNFGAGWPYPPSSVTLLTTRLYLPR